MTADKSAVEGLRCELSERLGEPTRCKVWRDGVLVFDGVSLSAAVMDGPSFGNYWPVDERPDVEALIEASSLGTPEAKAARESVPPDDVWMVPYATGYPPGPAVMVEPRASCLTCRLNVAVTSSGRLRCHLDRRRPYHHGRQNWCKGARL